MCVFPSFFSPLTKRKVELSNGNWKEIERVEVNLGVNDKPNLVEEIEENNDVVEKTNGSVITEGVERANGESKAMKEQVDEFKVWL